MSVRTSLLPGSGTIRCSLVENSMVAYSSASLANWEETVVQFLPKYAAFFIRLSTTFGYSSPQARGFDRAVCQLSCPLDSLISHSACRRRPQHMPHCAHSPCCLAPLGNAQPPEC